MKHRLLSPVLLSLLAAPLVVGACTSETSNDEPDGSGGSGAEGGEISGAGGDGGEMSSTSTGPVPACGDGFVQPGEECDDGNDDDADGCSAACEVELGFNCKSAPSVCASTCGDGVRASDETCDDDNEAAGDGCASDCNVEVGFVCDANHPSACNGICGDGLVLGQEECDDDNDDAGDGCSAQCLVEPGYECDDAEPSECDGILWAATNNSGGFGTFYKINLGGPSIEEIGQLDEPITALASDGTTLYAMASETASYSGADGGEGMLYTVERSTGELTEVGLVDRGNGTPWIPDMTFHGGELFAYVRQEGGSTVGRMGIVDLDDDLSYSVFGDSGSIGYTGYGLASNGTSMFLAPEDSSFGSLYSVNPADGEVTELDELVDCEPSSGSGIGIGAMTFHNGTLYAVTTSSFSSSVLFELDPDSATCTEVLDLEVNWVDALGSDAP